MQAFLRRIPLFAYSRCWCILAAIFVASAKLSADSLKSVKGLTNSTGDEVIDFDLADNWMLRVAAQNAQTGQTALTVMKPAQIEFSAKMPPDANDIGPNWNVLWVVDGPGPFEWRKSPATYAGTNAATFESKCVVAGTPPVGSSLNGCTFWVTAYAVDFTSKKIKYYFCGEFKLACNPGDFETTPTQISPGNYTIDFGITNAKTAFQAEADGSTKRLSLTITLADNPEGPILPYGDFTLAGYGGISIPYNHIRHDTAAGHEHDYLLQISDEFKTRGNQVLWGPTSLYVPGGSGIKSATLKVQ